jgi:hypothetical protein
MKAVLANWRFWAPPMAIFVFLAWLRFGPFLMGQTLYFGDNFSLLVPGKIFTAYWLKQGVLPLWNPTILGGIPWIGDISQSILYPSTLFFILFKPAHALSITIITHLLFTFGGMYLLARSIHGKGSIALIAATLWTFSTQVAGSTNNLATFQAIAWFPWVSYFGLRLHQSPKAIWGLALAVTGQLAAGYPQYVLFSGFTAAVLWWIFLEDRNWRLWLKRGLVATLFIIGLSAVYWLPFVETLLASTRVSQSLEQAGEGSFHPLMAIKLLIPYFWDMPTLGYKWGPAWSGQPNLFMYFSWTGLIGLVSYLYLRKRSRQEKKLLLFGLLLLVMALGKYLPGLNLVQQQIPILSSGRNPSMSLIPATMILSMLVAKALATIRVTGLQLKRLIMAIAAVGVASLLIRIIWLANPIETWELVDRILLGKLSTSPFHTWERDTLIASTILLSLTAIAFLTIVELKLWWQKRYRLLALILGINLAFNTQGLFFFTDNSLYDYQISDPYPLTESIKAHTSPQHRWLTRNFNMPYTDYGMYWEAMVVRAPFSDSFIDANELSSQAVLARIQQGLTPNWNMPLNLPMVHGYTTMLPDDYASRWDHNENRINYLDSIPPEAAELGRWSTRYYIVDRWFQINEELSQFPAVFQDDQFEILELPAYLPRFRYDDGSPIDLIGFVETPNLIQFSLMASDHQVGVVADRYDPNWKLSINGEDVELVNLEGLRKFLLSEGVNEISLAYRPKMFYYGLILSGLSLMAIIFYERRWR